MNLYQAVEKRIDEYKLKIEFSEMRRKLKEAGVWSQDNIAHQVIVEWIEKSNNITLEGMFVKVNEQRYPTLNEVWYSVEIQFGPDCYINTVSRIKICADLSIVVENWSDGERLWHAVRDGYYFEFDDLIDAVIYVTYADSRLEVN
jgi:hypothetical protein